MPYRLLPSWFIDWARKVASELLRQGIRAPANGLKFSIGYQIFVRLLQDNRGETLAAKGLRKVAVSTEWQVPSRKERLAQILHFHHSNCVRSVAPRGCRQTAAFLNVLDNRDVNMTALAASRFRQNISFYWQVPTNEFERNITGRQLSRKDYAPKCMKLSTRQA